MEARIKLIICLLLVFCSINGYAFKCYHCLSREECSKDLELIKDPDECIMEAPMSPYCVLMYYYEDSTSGEYKEGDVYMRYCRGAELKDHEVGKCYREGEHRETCYCAEDFCNA